jgi:hypothetical protein
LLFSGSKAAAGAGAAAAADPSCAGCGSSRRAVAWNGAARGEPQDSVAEGGGRLFVVLSQKKKKGESEAVRRR